MWDEGRKDNASFGSASRFANVPKNITVHYHPKARHRAQELIGRNLPDAHVAALAGALDEATVDIALHGETLFFNLKHPDILFQHRRLARDEQGRLYVRNLYFEKQPWGRPLTGLRALLRQIEFGQPAGVSYLITNAVGKPEEEGLNGYYTWARYGFDAELPADRQRLLWGDLLGSKTLNDIMLRDGAKWWRTEGVPLEMSFDLHPDSSMMKALQRYLEILRKEGRWP